MEKQNNVPKLRFLKFEQSWERKIFDEIMSITRLAGYEYSEYWKEDESKEIIALRGYNIGKGKLELINLGYISNELSLKLNRSRLYKGDIVYPCVGTIGNAVVVEEDNKYHIQQNIAKLTPKENIDSYFIAQFLMSNWGMKEVNRFNATSSQPNVLVGSLRRFEIALPSLPEQQKIATFLSTVDEKIQALKKKKSLLETYKKGVMQKLFLQKIRFKDDEGNDFEDWEVKKLGEIAVFSKGKNISKADIVENGVTECIRYGELYTYYGETINQIKSRTNISLDNLILSEANDIIIPASGETQIDIATASCVLKSGVALGGDLNIIKTKQNGVFMSYYLNNAQKQQIASLAQGISVVHLYSSQLALLEIQLPSLAEQTKIANFLTAIDEKINKVDAQIKQTELWKKGLLQQMFV
jgi:type I restriction enzyme S subunit